MKYVIDEDVCKNAHLDIHLLLTILLLNTGTKFEDNLKELIDREIIVEQKTLLGVEYAMTHKWIDVVSGILLDSKRDNVSDFDTRLENLSRRLMDIFPKGKKMGTNHYWKCNVKDVKLKLKKFFEKYSDKYTDEEIINATQSYVDSFNGNYTFMRILKYFIWKDETKMGGEVGSDLADILENAGQQNEYKSDIGELV